MAIATGTGAEVNDSIATGLSLAGILQLDISAH